MAFGRRSTMRVCQPFSYNCELNFWVIIAKILWTASICVSMLRCLIILLSLYIHLPISALLPILYLSIWLGLYLRSMWFRHLIGFELLLHRRCSTRARLLGDDEGSVYRGLPHWSYGYPLWMPWPPFQLQPCWGRAKKGRHVTWPWKVLPNLHPYPGQLESLCKPSDCAGGMVHMVQAHATFQSIDSPEKVEA